MSREIKRLVTQVCNLHILKEFPLSSYYLGSLSQVVKCTAA